MGLALTLKIVGRHHAGIAGKNGLHAQFALALQNLLAQVFLALIPPFGVGAAPSLEVAHEKPCLIGRASHEAIGLGACVAHGFEHAEPHHVGPHQGQRHVDAVEGHPVDFLLPAFPRPEGHGVGKRAVVKVVAQLGLAFAPLLLGGQRQWGLRQVEPQLLPCDLLMGHVVQIPVYAGGYGQCAAALDAGLSVAASHYEDVGARGRLQGGVYDCDEALGRALASYAVEQAAYGVGLALAHEAERG